jgi:hypothetical protein
MAAAVGKMAANVFLKKEMKKYKNKKVDSGNVSTTTTINTIYTHTTNTSIQDPYFAMVEDPKRPGKYIKKKKQIPSYIPAGDAEILAKVRKRSYRLDMCLFNFLGIRFGWEAVIGIIPMIGDAVGVLFALMVFQTCCKVDGGLSSGVKLRMLLNIAADFAVGLVPFIGDLADAAFKCNTRNLRLLENTLDKRYKPSSSRRDERDMVGVDREKRRKNRESGMFRRDDPPPATVFEEFSDDELRDEHGDSVQRPPPARGGERRDEIPMTERRQETGRVQR